MNDVPRWYPYASAALHAELDDAPIAEIEALLEQIPPEDMPKVVLTWIDTMLGEQGFTAPNAANRGKRIGFLEASTAEVLPAPDVPPAIRQVSRLIAARFGDDEDAFNIVMEECAETGEAWNGMVYGALHVVAQGILHERRHHA